LDDENDFEEEENCRRATEHVALLFFCTVVNDEVAARMMIFIL
jgi:hypothetical protein|tara:strand:- start:1739 stop:1867 length:129 start_codon:yes stop_codon:yes gene_type:complete